MQKSSDALRTISEVAEDLDVPKHVLRFWESKFSQVNPMKRGGGRRYYRPADIELLKGIRHLLYADGFTIKGVQKIFKRDGIDYVKKFAHQQGDAPGVAAQGAAPKVTAKKSNKSAAQKTGEANHEILQSLLAEIKKCRKILSTV